MLILPKNKALFYHVYKVAGSSIRKALLPYADRRQIFAQSINHALLISRLPRSSNPLHSYHPRLKDVKAKMGERFYDYYRFAFVRDPLDWQKSLYFFMLKKGHLPGNRRITGMTFDEYLLWRMDHELRFQTDFIFDRGECLVDDIYHFETIEEDFRRLASKIGIESRLPHLNRAGMGKKAPASSEVLKRFFDLHAQEYERLGYLRPRID